MKKKINQLRRLAATIMLVAAMVMPSTAWAKEMYTVFDTGTSTLTFKYDDNKPADTDTQKVYDIPENSSEPKWISNHASAINTVVFDESFKDARPKSSYAWFDKCTSLTTISGIEHLNTEEVTSMNYMFYRCTSLTTLDLSGFNTAKVEYMLMMFYGCSSLTTIYVSEQFTTSAVTFSDRMFGNCSSLVGAIKYDPDKTDVNYANMNDGYFTLVGTVAKPKGAYVEYTDADKTLTFKYGEIPESTDTEKVYDIPYGVTTPEWQKNHASSIQKVVFDVTFKDARPKSCNSWFRVCTSLTTISGIENLNTEEVTDMTYMFGECRSLTTLDLSGFNTTKVEEMSVMFYSCSKLTTIFVSDKFTTSAVTSSINMFDNCPSLVGAIKYDDNINDKTGANYATGYFTYAIKTAADLASFAECVNTEGNEGGVAVLFNDITMTENDNVAPIGSNEYTGTFDGRGHSIGGLNFNAATPAIFSQNSGTIKNLGVVNAAIASGSNGSICQTNSGTIENCFFAGTTEGTTSPSGAICQTNSGTVTNCYYLADSETDVIEGTTAKTAAQFKGGEVAWLLNGSSSDGEWGQQIDSEDYPVWGGAKVYQCTPCTGVYSNDENKVTAEHTVSYDNGFGICSVCGDKLNVYEPATLNASDEYEIGNAGQLCWFAGLVNGTLTDGTQQNTTAKGVLTGNIDLASISNWTPIGNASNMFGGTFDGNNFKVQHLSITQQGSNTGLFGYVSGATMQNICIDGNITLTTTGYTEGYGSIAGRMDNSTISNCHSSVNFSIDSEMTSGNCIGHIGGIVGQMFETSSTDSNVQGCSYSGTINLGNKNVNVAAGIAGYAIYSYVPINNCSFTGTIKSECNDAIIMGGIFGYTNSGGEVKVTNCLQAGTLVKPGDSSLTGMLIGQINGGYGANAVTNNYYISDTFNVIGKTTGTPTTTPATQCSTEQLQSGEICYLLNGSSPDGAWGQQIGTDDYPVPGSDKTVYEVNLLCGGVKAVGKTYVNSNEDVTIAHELPEAANFNAEKNIYDKVCQREGCGETIYYANAAGSIEATPDADATEFTVANYPLQDATTYDNKAVFTATNFIYTRTFSNTNWTTWYVPFDLKLTNDICAHYDFSRINNVHQYDTDNDGTADKTVVESFRQMPGVTLKANYPYLVKPVSEGDLNMVLPLEGVQPALAETNSIDCQSVDFSYTFTGTYTAMGEGGSGYYDPYTLWTDGTWQHFRSLDPMRHFLTVTQRNPFFASAASLRSIMLSVIGDEGTTGIVNMYSDERKAAETYDLGGRRLPAGASQRGVMIENGKVIIKK